MLRRIIVALVCLSFFMSHSSFAEGKVTFDRWPLDDFKKESIIKDFGNGHFGLDLQATEGTPVYAPVSGKIYWTYSGGSHGTSVGLEHSSGLRMTFLHLSERLVKKGQDVDFGQEIGRVGMTGSGRDSEPAHLHFAVIVDAEAPVTKPELRYANPLDFLPALPVAEEPAPEEQPAPSPAPAPEEKPASEPVPAPEQQPAPAPMPAPEQIALPSPVLSPVATPVKTINTHPLVTSINLAKKTAKSQVDEKILRPNKAFTPLGHNIIKSQTQHALNRKLARQKLSKHLTEQSPVQKEINEINAKEDSLGVLIKICLILLIGLAAVIYYIWSNRKLKFRLSA